MRKFNLKVLLAVLPLIMALWGQAAVGRTIHVPGDFNSIQVAINDANNSGDEIEVAAGIYYEAINFKGKALRLYSSSGPEVTTIDANGAYHVVQCASGEDANTILEGFTITGGNANGPGFDTYGGGMYNSASSPTVTNCTFTSNSARVFGGGMCNEDGNPMVTNCTFTSNKALAGQGGGMCNLRSNSTVTNCTFSDNQAFEYGGGMCNLPYSSPTATNCTFSGNAAEFGGGMCNFQSKSTVTNCIFSGNSADNGGGMSNFECNPTMTNCIFSGNTADNGGGMSNDHSGNSTVTNCILWGDSPEEIYNGGTSTATVTYSDVEGGWSGTGNIDADPCFVNTNNPDPKLWNLRLKPDSPCIDAGDTTAFPIGIFTDVDGNPRVLDNPTSPDRGVSFLGMTVDIGAYEFNPCQIPGDINCDGVVDFKDVAILCGNWLAGTEP